MKGQTEVKGRRWARKIDNLGKNCHKVDDPTHLRCVDNVDKGKKRSQDSGQEVTPDLSDRGQLICIVK